MGYATIVSGGTDGRYTISLDFGEAQRTALLAALSTLLAALEIKIADAQTKVNEAEAKEADYTAAYNVAVEDFIARNPFFPAGSPKPDDSAVKFTLKQLRDLQTANEPYRIALAGLKFERAQALKQVAYWNNVQATETRPAWCADFTEDAAPGSVVATMDIPGDSNLLVIAPGARGWTPADGVLAAREFMSPSEAFFNAAIFPGWQIDKPTYRWGTVTGINHNASTLDVQLAPATSSAQRLNVNRQTQLAGVPADYMETGTAVYEVSDRVVVQFQSQSWSSPRVVGFLDNPRPVGIWNAATITSDNSYGTPGDISPETYTSLFCTLRLGSDPDIATLRAGAEASGVCTYRVNRGAWRPMTQDPGENGGLNIFIALDGSNVAFIVSATFAAGPGAYFNVSGDSNLLAGDIVECRLFIGPDLMFNAALQHLPSDGIGPVAIVGALLDLDPGTGAEPGAWIPLSRLPNYRLYQVTGD